MFLYIKEIGNCRRAGSAHKLTIEISECLLVNTGLHVLKQHHYERICNSELEIDVFSNALHSFRYNSLACLSSSLN